jgi:hypothetical protein
MGQAVSDTIRGWKMLFLYDCGEHRFDCLFVVGEI